MDQHQLRFRIIADWPRATDYVDPLIADGQSVDGLVIVRLPNAEQFLNLPSPAADFFLASAVRTLARRYPSREFGLLKWLPCPEQWPNTNLVLATAGFGPIQSRTKEELVLAWKWSTESSNKPGVSPDQPTNDR